jgi:cardiolipin synthase
VSEVDLEAWCRRDPEPFLWAESVRLLADGSETYPAMLRAIAEAQESIVFENYIFATDRAGRLFRDALVEAGRRGVAVRFLYDAVGSWAIDRAFRQPMLEAGIQVAVFHPLQLTRPLWLLNRRDHRKILIVDRRLSFTGGVNVSDDNLPEAKGEAWRDTHVEIEGAAAAARLATLFEAGWRRAHHFPADGSRPRRRLETRFPGGRAARDRAAAPAGAPAGAGPEGRATPRPPVRGVLVRVLGNGTVRNRFRIRRAYLEAIERASRYVLIENAYFIPSHVFLRTLAKAVRRGVEVRVLLARRSDVPAAGWASRALYQRLMDDGVRLSEWPRGMMHSKTATIDGIWSIVGSYNLDQRSLWHNLEVVVEVVDPEFAAALSRRTVDGLAASEPVDAEAHRRRGIAARLLERLGYAFRYWL